MEIVLIAIHRNTTYTQGYSWGGGVVSEPPFREIQIQHRKSTENRPRLQR